MLKLFIAILGSTGKILKSVWPKGPLQWCAIEFLHLLHKPYWNRVTLSRDYIHWKSFHGLVLLDPSKYEIDISNQVVNIDFGQGAAKVSEVKVGGQK